MVLLKDGQLDTKVNNSQNSNVQYFIELFWIQIKQQVPTWGCILIAQQDQSPNIIEAIYLANSGCQNQINHTFFHNLDLNNYRSESEVYCDSIFLGYIYLLPQASSQARCLIIFSDNFLSVTQRQIVQDYNQLLQQYLALEAQYQQKNHEVKRLETLCYQIGHHLRNPLAEISIIAETICLSSTIGFCQNQANIIKNKIINLNLEITNFFYLHKRSKNCLQLQDIKPIFQKSLNNLNNLVTHKNIKIKYPQKSALLKIEPLQLSQIFDNLLSNAIYFSPSGGIIDCYWQSFQEEVLISICDRGCGLSSEDIQNMFLPFYSRRENGQGLGLTIVKKIILDLNGNIWAENLPQGGTKINLVLPKIN